MYGVDSKEPLTLTLSSSPRELAHAKDASLGRSRKSKRLGRGTDDVERQRTLEAVIEHESCDSIESPSSSPLAPHKPQAPSPNMQQNAFPSFVVGPEAANPLPAPPTSATMEALQTDETLHGLPPMPLPHNRESSPTFQHVSNSFEQIPSQESPPTQSKALGLKQHTPDELQQIPLESVSEPIGKPKLTNLGNEMKSKGSSHAVAFPCVFRLPTSSTMQESGSTSVTAQKKLGRNENDFQDGCRQKPSAGRKETRSASLPFRPRSAAPVNSNAATLSRSAMLRTRPRSAPSLTVTSNEPGNARMIYIKAGTSPSIKSKNEQDLSRRLLQIQGIFSEETSDLLQIQDVASRSSHLKSCEVSQSKATKLPQWILSPDPKPNKRMTRARSATYRR